MVDEIVETANGEDFDDSFYKKKKRWQLTKEQVWVLENEFKSNHNVWAKSKYLEFSRILKVPLSKLYKWNWDRRKKQRKIAKRTL